jgi:hypothetical protein
MLESKVQLLQQENERISLQLELSRQALLGPLLASPFVLCFSSFLSFFPCLFHSFVLFPSCSATEIQEQLRRRRELRHQIQQQISKQQATNSDSNSLTIPTSNSSNTKNKQLAPPSSSTITITSSNSLAPIPESPRDVLNQKSALSSFLGNGSTSSASPTSGGGSGGDQTNRNPYGMMDPRDLRARLDEVRLPPPFVLVSVFLFCSFSRSSPSLPSFHSFSPSFICLTVWLCRKKTESLNRSCS